MVSSLVSRFPFPSNPHGLTPSGMRPSPGSQVCYSIYDSGRVIFSVQDSSAMPLELTRGRGDSGAIFREYGRRGPLSRLPSDTTLRGPYERSFLFHFTLIEFYELAVKIPRMKK